MFVWGRTLSFGKLSSTSYLAIPSAVLDNSEGHVACLPVSLGWLLESPKSMYNNKNASTELFFVLRNLSNVWAIRRGSGQRYGMDLLGYLYIQQQWGDCIFIGSDLCVGVCVECTPMEIFNFIPFFFISGRKYLKWWGLMCLPSPPPTMSGMLRLKFEVATSEQGPLHTMDCWMGNIRVPGKKLLRPHRGAHAVVAYQKG